MPNQAATTSVQLFKQSEALRQQAESMKRREIPDVVARMKEAIAHYGLSSAQLGFGGAKAAAVQGTPKAAAKKSKKNRPSVVKYRDDKGHSWTGFGPKPRWLKEALASGVSESSLRP